MLDWYCPTTFDYSFLGIIFFPILIFLCVSAYSYWPVEYNNAFISYASFDLSLSKHFFISDMVSLISSISIHLTIL